MTRPHPTILLAATVMLGGCGTDPYTQPADTTTTTTTEVAVAPPPVPTTAVVDAPAIATRVAETVTPRTTPAPPPDPCTLEEYVNALPYRRLDPTSANTAYGIVAACLGWTIATIDFYRAGIIDDILPGESSLCPLIRGGQHAHEDCTPYGKVTGDDTGWYQLTRAAWGSNAVLCLNHGYCSWQSIVQSPWHSMRAGLLLIMEAGRFPWTWDAWACQFHSLVCRTWPRHFEMLP